MRTRLVSCSHPLRTGRTDIRRIARVYAKKTPERSMDLGQWVAQNGTPVVAAVALLGLVLLTSLVATLRTKRSRRLAHERHTSLFVNNTAAVAAVDPKGAIEQFAAAS